MIHAEVFLANLQGSAASATKTSTLTLPSLSALPPSILRLCKLGLRLAPILAHSTSASIKGSMTAVPTSDEASLALSARDRCNWAAATGHGLAILEVNVEEGQRSLRYLCGDEWEWCETLEFRRGASRFFAFHHPSRRIRFLGSRFPGLKLHWEGSAVLIPPSWFVYGPPVTFENPDAPVLSSPRWLLAAENTGWADHEMTGSVYERSR